MSKKSKKKSQRPMKRRRHTQPSPNQPLTERESQLLTEIQSLDETVHCRAADILRTNYQMGDKVLAALQSMLNSTTVVGAEAAHIVLGLAGLLPDEQVLSALKDRLRNTPDEFLRTILNLVLTNSLKEDYQPTLSSAIRTLLAPASRPDQSGTCIMEGAQRTLDPGRPRRLLRQAFEDALPKLLKSDAGHFVAFGVFPGDEIRQIGVDADLVNLRRRCCETGLRERDFLIEHVALPIPEAEWIIEVN